MAINAKQAAQLVNEGKFDDLDELYDALVGTKDYTKELEVLLNHINTKVQLDIILYAGLADSAHAVEKYSKEIDPLDEKDSSFEECRAKLSKIELYETVEEDGKEVVKVIKGKERSEMISQMVAAAKLEADSELRGASSPVSPDAKRFMNEKDEARKKAIYKKVLDEKIDLAILQSFLVNESQKINKEMSEKYGENEEKAAEEAKILLSARRKEIQKKISALGKGVVDKISVSAEGVAAYCAQAAVRVEDQLQEYKGNIKKIANRINKGFAKLKDKGKDLRNKWKTIRASANKTFETCNDSMSKKIAVFNEGCKRVWNTTYTIAKQVARNIADRKYEIGADMLAAAGYSVALCAGGPAAIVGGAAYAAYTIGRRVIYEAYKQKKENPSKSYKEIYTKPKFIARAVFACTAASLSYGIANTVATAGADVATQTAVEIGEKLAAQRLLKRSVSVFGGVTSSIVGVATAEDKKERKKEWIGLGASALTGAFTLFLSEALGDRSSGETDVKGGNANVNTAGVTTRGLENANASSGKGSSDITHQMLGKGMRTDSVAHNTVAGNDADSVAHNTVAGNGADSTEHQIPTAAGTADQSTPDHTVTASHEPEGEFVMKEFPSQWNEDMGISKKQFDKLVRNLSALYTEQDDMERVYSHAAYYAASLSMDPENPMTPEQIMFKFTRLSVITSAEKGGRAVIGTGSLGEQLGRIYHLLGCGDQMSAEQMEEARRTLDICTLNEAGRQDGRMDAEKFFAVAGEGYENHPVDADGTLTMTNEVYDNGIFLGCPDDGLISYAKAGGGDVVIKESVPAVDEQPEVVIEKKSGLDIEVSMPVNLDIPAEEFSAPVPDPEPEIVVGTFSHTGESPATDGVVAIDQLTKDSEAAQVSGRKARLARKLCDELVQKGKLPGGARE